MGMQSDAAAALKKYINQHKGMMLVAEILERCGSFENAEIEAKSAYVKADQERATVEAELKALKNKMGTTKQAYEEVLSEATLKSENVMKETDIIVDEKLIAANRDSDKIIADAEAVAQAKIIEADEYVKRETVQQDSLIKQRQTDLAELDRRVEVKAKKEIDLDEKISSLEAKLAEIKAQASRMAG